MAFSCSVEGARSKSTSAIDARLARDVLHHEVVAGHAAQADRVGRDSSRYVQCQRPPARCSEPASSQEAADLAQVLAPPKLSPSRERAARRPRTSGG